MIIIKSWFRIVWGLPKNVNTLKVWRAFRRLSSARINYLEKSFHLREMDQIDEKIMNLKKVLTNINFEPSYLFSLIQNAATALNDITIAPHSAFDSKKWKLAAKYLDCADTLGNSFTEWPEQFKPTHYKKLKPFQIGLKKARYIKQKEPVLSPEPAGSRAPIT